MSWTATSVFTSVLERRDSNGHSSIPPLISAAAIRAILFCRNVTVTSYSLIFSTLNFIRDGNVAEFSRSGGPGKLESTIHGNPAGMEVRLIHLYPQSSRPVGSQTVTHCFSLLSQAPGNLHPVLHAAAVVKID